MCDLTIEIVAVSCRFVLVVGNSLMALGGSPVQGRIIYYFRDVSTVGTHQLCILYQGWIYCWGALIVYIISGMNLLWVCTDCVYYISDGYTVGVH